MTPTSDGPASHVGVVLLYHRVASAALDSHRLCVAPETFAFHARVIARTCHAMPLEELVQSAAAGTLPPRAVAITFDDGYEDAIAAVDVLVSKKLPATIFMTTARLGEPEPYHYWWDVLEWALLTPGVLAGNELQVSLPDGRRDFPLRLESDRRTAHLALHSALLPLDDDARDLALAPITELVLARQPALPRRMSLGELRSLLACPGVTVGAHTKSHLFLPAHPRECQRLQIRSSLETLGGALDTRVTALAYPFGGLTADTVSVAAEQGLTVAVTTVASAVSEATQPLAVPRVDAAASTMLAFEERLESLFGGMVQH